MSPLPLYFSNKLAPICFRFNQLLSKIFEKKKKKKKKKLRKAAQKADTVALQVSKIRL